MRKGNVLIGPVGKQTLYASDGSLRDEGKLVNGIKAHIQKGAEQLTVRSSRRAQIDLGIVGVLDGETVQITEDLRELSFSRFV